MRIHLLSCLVACLFVVCGVSTTVFAQSTDATIRVTDIRVEGNRRVSVGTVQSYLPVRVGDLTSQNALDNALQRLYQTNLFQNITLSLDGSVLVVKLTENPIINRVNIEGNDALSDERLLEIIDVQPRRVYNRKMALDATQKLIDIYRASGRYAAVIEPKVITLDENRVDLVFEVDEGPLIKIQKITFSGNEAFSDRQLRQAIVSRETKWWAFLAANDKYDEGRLEYDIRLLRQFYLARGYADIKIERARGGLLPDRSGFVISFLVDEGVRYKVGDVTITSAIDAVDPAAMKQALQFGDERWYDMRALEQGLLDISRQLGALGYAFVNVTPDIKTDPETATLDIAIRIDEAQRNFVERIEFVDNNRTLDRVIRREFEIVEGDAYNQLKIERSVRNIRNLGYFSDVKVQTLPGSSADQSITRVAVQEQSTGDFSIGAGYSSLDQARISFGINERNFLGTGRRASVALSTSGTKTSFNVGLTEPYLLGRNLSGSIDVFNDETTDDDTKIKRTGFRLGLGFSAARDVYHRLSYQLSKSRTTTETTTATSVTGEEGKTLLRSSVDYTIGRDTRDNKYDPTRGFSIELEESISGLGGDVKFLSSVLSASYYKPMMFNEVVLGASGKIGYITGLSGKKVTQSNRFQMGGREVRGFAGGGIGPRDNGSLDAVGGNTMFAGRLEVVSGLGFDKDSGLRWTVFNDFGSLWDTDYPTGVTGATDSSLRASVGVGLYWNTAIGPLSFSFASPYAKKSYDQTKSFQFSIGTRL